ncbi:MAG TPA: hypothetical protein VFJ06_02170 [Halococcus sp.]|nr:hypothetical protein [Halococcus sp.]
MGVMCSLLGHDYGETDVERERTEQGDEVIRTAKRVERCRNCNHTRTISENTEVTLEAAAGVVREPDGTVVAATDGMGNAVSEADGGIVIESSSERETTLDTPDSTGDEQTAVSDTDEESVELGDIDRIRDSKPVIHTTTSERNPGEWPTEPGDERTQNAETPETGGLGSSGSLALESRVGWSDETDAPAETKTISGKSFACASCGFSAVVADSPLRAGDICPGCGHGYLAWETRKG